MILFTLLAIVLAILIVFLIGIIAVGGAIGIIVFADVIVCACIIGWIMYRLIRKRNK